MRYQPALAVLLVALVPSLPAQASNAFTKKHAHPSPPVHVADHARQVRHAAAAHQVQPHPQPVAMARQTEPGTRQDDGGQASPAQLAAQNAKLAAIQRKMKAQQHSFEAWSACQRRLAASLGSNGKTKPGMQPVSCPKMP